MTQKLQTGGSVNLTYFANPYKGQPKATSTTDSSKEDGLISEDLLKKLSEKGIPVDVDNLLKAVGDLEYKQSMGVPVSSRTVRQLEAQINRVIQQSNYLEQAEERAMKNEAFGEVAVGDRGELFTFSENGDIQKIAAGSYNAEKHGPALTVNELIEQRKFNPTQAYDTAITTAIGNNIGMSKISEYIQKIVASVGSSETSSEAYTDLTGIVGREAAKKPTQEQLQTLQQLYQLSQTVGMDAIFKEKNLLKQKNIQEAFGYINSILPRNMRLQMQARFIAAGYTPEQSANNVSEIIGQALMSGNDVQQSYNIEYSASANKDLQAKSQSRNLGVLEQLVQGSLGKRDYKLMSSKNPEFSLNLHGTGVGSLATFNNNIVDKSPLSIALQSGLAPLIDENHITIGNQKVPVGAFDTILYNGGDVINVWAPVNAEGDVDLEGLQLLSEIQSICDTNPNLTVEDKNNLLKKYQLDGYFDEKGTFHGTGQMAQFLVMTGLTSDEVLDASSNPYADKLNRDDKQLEFKQLERIYGQLNKGVKGNGKYEFAMGWFKGTTDLYKVPIFMRLNQTAQIDAGTFSDKGPMVQTPTYEQQLAYDQMHRNQTRSLITPSTQALYE